MSKSEQLSSLSGDNNFMFLASLLFKTQGRFREVPIILDNQFKKSLLNFWFRENKLNSKVEKHPA
ncbi:hypothetical protein GYH30_042915 [Glycine max]|uniref:Uncharacterized protein n=1 Tax=Glycine max TaxID=3847 RepID=A0A0R0G3Q6_SOYBN|nr:hypothetical protein GYH30_042915 [Glycine max]